ncbi:MAG: YceI family protein [Bacteroidales bacterium]|jgi:polyisoprenoid-binding protein YceI|nr:YceI family protein [Bacteroidales bacterium]
MKQYFFLILSLFLFSCGARPTADKAKTEEAINTEKSELEPGDWKIDSTQSVIRWKGFKSGGAHYGTVLLKDGTLNIEDGAVTGGKFFIDMNSIVCENLVDTTSNKRLIHHLKGIDFFHVEQFPTCEFVITSTTKKEGTRQEITGNLLLRGIEKSITFPADVSIDNKTVTAVTPDFTIDRTQWGVNYGSKSFFKEMKDSFVNDGIEISIRIVAK